MVLSIIGLSLIKIQIGAIFVIKLIVLHFLLIKNSIFIFFFSNN